MARMYAQLRREPYLVFAVIIFALLLPFIIGQPWHIDLGMHLATIVRWDHDFFAPRNPLIDVAGPSPYYSPYMLIWVSLVKVFGLTQFTVLKIAAGLNVIILLVGVRLFVGTFTRSAAAMMLSFAAMLLIWGVGSIVWSGLFPLGTLLITLGFPSTFAAACTLILFALVRIAAAEPRPSRPTLVSIVLISAMIILSHPITAAAAALGVVIILAPQLIRQRRLRPVLLWTGVGLTAVLLTLLWPWFRPTTLLASPDSLDDLHSTLYEDVWQRYGLLLLTVPALIVRFKRDRLDPLPMLAIANFALVLIGYLTGHFSLARMITWAAFPAQIAAGLELHRALVAVWQRRFSWARLAVIISTGSALIIGAAGQLGLVRTYLPEQTRNWPQWIEAPYELWGDYDWAAQHVGYGDVVLTMDKHALRMLPGYGAYTVAPAYPDPLLPQAQPERKAVSSEFLDDDDTSWKRRAQIVQDYGVDWVLAGESKWNAPDGARSGVSYQRVAAGPDGEVLYRVTKGHQPEN